MSRGYRDEESKEEIGTDVGEASVVRETEKALLVRLHDHKDKELWVPKSQIHDDSEVYEEGTEGILLVTEWFAEEEGLV